jgi:hypothetical protein
MLSSAMSASVSTAAKPPPATDWGSIQAEEEARSDALAASAGKDEEQEEAEEEGFEVIAPRKKRALGPKQDDTILLFQEAYTHPTYVYTKQIVRSYHDLEHLYSPSEARRCQNKGVAYKHEYYHGYSLNTHVVWSFHHGGLRAHKKLVDEELADYLEKLRACLPEYKRACRTCQGPRHDLFNGMSFCFACDALSLKKKKL